MRVAVAIGHQLFERSALVNIAVPDEIPRPAAAFDPVIAAGNWIHQYVAVRYQHIGDRVVDSLKDVGFPGSRYGKTNIADFLPDNDGVTNSSRGGGKKLRAVA